MKKNSAEAYIIEKLIDDKEMKTKFGFALILAIDKNIKGSIANLNIISKDINSNLDETILTIILKYKQ